MSGLADDLRELARLRKIEAILGRRKKAITAARTEHERATFARMQDEGWKPGEASLKLEGTVHIPQETHYATIQDRIQLIEWLREHDDSVIESERLRDGELNRIVRTRLDNGEGMPPGLGYWTKTYISTRGANAPTTQEDHDEEG